MRATVHPRRMLTHAIKFPETAGPCDCGLTRACTCATGKGEAEEPTIIAEIRPRYLT